MSMKKIDQCEITGEIVLLSGMRIGGSDDVLQIGGTDLTCIRDPASGLPYIPGSSLKGKMRSSLEKHLDKLSSDGREPCRCGLESCPVCRIFGPHRNTNHRLGPTRLIVRDATLIGINFTIENKTESTNLRNTGAAQHPRTVERIAPGAKFRFRLAVQALNLDENFTYPDPDNNNVVGKNALVEAVLHAVDLMESTGIGSGVGKGYGEIRIDDLKWQWTGAVRHRTTTKPE